MKKDRKRLFTKNVFEEVLESVTRPVSAVPQAESDRASRKTSALKKRGDSTEEVMHWLTCVKSDVTSAITNAHGLTVGDLVLVSPGSIPTTTSGKIRRAACVEQYRRDQFTRLDA